MNRFEELSCEIKRISQLHAQERFTRMTCLIDYLWRKFCVRKPLGVKWVADGTGTPVGRTVVIYHGLYKDFMKYQAQIALTRLILRRGMCVNAFSVVSRDLTQAVRKTTIQPRWVES